MNTPCSCICLMNNLIFFVVILYLFLLHASVTWGLGEYTHQLSLSLSLTTKRVRSNCYIRGDEVNEIGVIHSYLRCHISHCNNMTEKLAVVWLLPSESISLLICRQRKWAFNYWTLSRNHHLLGLHTHLSGAIRVLVRCLLSKWLYLSLSYETLL